MRRGTKTVLVGATLSLLAGAAVALAPQAAAIHGGGLGEGEVIFGEPTLVGGEPENGVKWVVRLLWLDDGSYCSGAVIADRWVLTAEHCIDNSSYADGVPSVGGAATPGQHVEGNFSDGSSTRAGIARIYEHPSADLALLALSEDYRITLADGSTGRPPAPDLASTAPIPGDRAIIRGYGALCGDCPLSEFPLSLGARRGAGDFPDSYGGTQDTYDGEDITYINPDTDFSVLYRAGNTEGGDSGGPVYDLERETLVGVTGGLADGTMVIEQTYQHRGWILETMGF